ARHRLRRERLLRHGQRMTREGRHDGRAELEARRLARAERRGEDRIHAEDVGEPAARKAFGLRPLRLSNEAVDVRRRSADVTDADADLHGAGLSAPAPSGGRPTAAARRRPLTLTPRATRGERRGPLSDALSGIRILDLTAEPGFFAGKVLGDLGADVVKVEPPAGDPARRRPPFWGGIPDPERGLLWLALNTSKRGLTLDLDRPRGHELFLDLVRRADVLLESEPPGRMAARGIGWQELQAENPRLVHCAVTPFGQSGPHAGWRGSDLTVCARSGNLYATGDPDRAPVRCSLPVAYYHGGIEAAVGVVFALLAREETGRGQHVDVALQEAMVMPN